MDHLTLPQFQLQSSLTLGLLAILLGLVYLLWGYRIFRILFALQFAAIGAFVGATGAMAAGRPLLIIPAAVCAAVVLALAAWFLVRLFVAIAAGLAAAGLVWVSTAQIHQPAPLLGAVGAFIVVCVLVHRYFHILLIITTALEGASLAILGLIQIIAGSRWQEVMERYQTEKPLRLLGMTVLLALPAMIYQFMRYRASARQKNAPGAPKRARGSAPLRCAA